MSLDRLASIDRPSTDLRTLMWTNVGLSRTAQGLQEAIDQLDVERETSSLATVAWLIARAALRREESRGGHYRADFPKKDDVNWRFHISQRIHG